VFIVAVISVTVFLILRRKYKKVYQPRSEEAILYEEYAHPISFRQ
jgi:hypothetical protein